MVGMWWFRCFLVGVVVVLNVIFFKYMFTLVMCQDTCEPNDLFQTWYGDRHC